MIKNSSKPSDGHSESPSSRPMTLRQQLDDLLSYLDEEHVYPLRMSKIEVRAAIEALCQEIAREARQTELEEWFNTYKQDGVGIEYTVSNSAVRKRIAELSKEKP